MGFMDGAVNGMASRLLAAGFSPEEALCLAQSAYVKHSKRTAGGPKAILDRQEVSWEINQAINALGPYPMGNEAHRQRIILWEKVFGFGSWHEPIDPSEIYSPLELLAHGHRTSGVVGDAEDPVPHGTYKVQKHELDSAAPEVSPKWRPPAVPLRTQLSEATTSPKAQPTGNIVPPAPPLQQSAGQWVWHSAVETNPVSGYRVAGGILSILLALWLLFVFVVQVSTGYFDGYLIWAMLANTCVLVAGLGAAVAGAILIGKARGRRRTMPLVLLGFITFGAFAMLMETTLEYGPGFNGLIVELVLSAPVIVILIMELRKDPGLH